MHGFALGEGNGFRSADDWYSTSVTGILSSARVFVAGVATSKLTQSTVAFGTWLGIGRAFQAGSTGLFSLPRQRSVEVETRCWPS